MMSNLGFYPKPEGDLSAAAAGLPASSRPSGAKCTELKNEKTDVTTEAKPEKVENTKAEENPAASVKAEVKSGPTPSEAPSTINSNTHRAAHARLSRKMQSLGEAECPNMQKLWNGTRKDSFFNN